jgi:cobyrinic acid a,c-diamide synthase
MCGIFDLSCELGSAPQGLGYVQAVVEKNNPYFSRGSVIKAHEFHYSTQTAPADTVSGCVLRLDKGVGLFKTGEQQRLDGLVLKNCFAGHMQVFAPGTPDWAGSFVATARKFMSQ